MVSNGKLNAEEPSLPRLAALFVITFDVKIGYSVLWKRSLPQVPVDGVVEYRSLPSGLHNVRQDLVYFSHDEFAGISAFLRGDAEEQNRNAKFVSVGALLPSNDGRLGRAWMHASSLTALARGLLADPDNLDKMQEYWEQNKNDGESSDSKSTQLSPFTLVQSNIQRTSTEAFSAAEKQTLPANHPIWSIVDYVNTFGPLVFPLHRAALLRKRILLIAPAPIRQTCEFVYDISITSSTPVSLANTLYLPSESLIRLRPLFSVGVHDIPQLESMAQSHDHEPLSGWLACSTDEILATKKDLFDIVVELPAAHDINGVKLHRPVIRSVSDNSLLKATQRDLRRWRMLDRIMGTASVARHDGESDDSNQATESYTRPLLHVVDSAVSNTTTSSDDDESRSLERTTWSELAYSSFLWWASAGEQDDFLIEENSHDENAMGDLLELTDQLIDERDDAQHEDFTNDIARKSKFDARLEVAIVSYFQRLTKTLLEVGAEILDEADNDDDVDDMTVAVSESDVNLGRDELRRLGLDAWSSNDRAFVEAFFKLWYSREIRIDKSSIECCGIKVC